MVIKRKYSVYVFSRLYIALQFDSMPRVSEPWMHRSKIPCVHHLILCISFQTPNFPWPRKGCLHDFFSTACINLAWPTLDQRSPRFSQLLLISPERTNRLSLFQRWCQLEVSVTNPKLTLSFWSVDYRVEQAKEASHWPFVCSLALWKIHPLQFS